VAGLLLALDTASPTVSVAVGRGEEVLAERSVELRRSSESLLRLVDECLEESGARVGDLEGVLALRGPGSFTGLRVGLATVLGLRQALGTALAATALPTLEVLALWGALRRPAGTVVAVVDALRGEWFAQPFDPRPAVPAALGEPQILSPQGVASCSPEVVVGFGARRLTTSGSWPEEIAVAEPAALAPAALRRAVLGPLDWDPELLTSPLYLRAPAVTLPKRRNGRRTGRRTDRR
jgi:tRNA threonylcarbamoyladenosine biosynthesis protein TsaB